jgi:hypothetical protein
MSHAVVAPSLFNVGLYVTWVHDLNERRPDGPRVTDGDNFLNTGISIMERYNLIQTTIKLLG